MLRPWVALLLLLPLTGCLNDFNDGVLQNRLDIHAIDVAAPVVKSGAVTFDVRISVDNEMARSGDVALVVKAFDADSGLLAMTVERDIGPIERDMTVPVSASMELPRSAGYRIEVSLLQDGQVIQVRSVTVTNLDALPPNVHDTGIRVASMDFLVRNASDGRALITANVYVTNEGATESQPLRLQVKAREVSTGLLADEEWIELPSVPPEETHAHESDLDVAQEYNYEVEVVVWDGSFIVGRGSGAVQLLPTFERPNDTEIEVNKPDLSDFTRERSAADRDERSALEEAATPGLGILLAMAALAIAASWRRRT